MKKFLNDKLDALGCFFYGHIPLIIEEYETIEETKKDWFQTKDRLIHLPTPYIEKIVHCKWRCNSCRTVNIGKLKFNPFVTKKVLK